jgi:predicted pyridoxine 5'-phosphate oxidase superfamily flavin-nucleotide-binding protein
MISINSETKKLIEENPVAFATVDEAGKPNVIGVAFVKVVAENKVLISDNYMKQTKGNLANNNNVCLAVWDKNWKGVKLIGNASYYESGQWKDYVEKMPENDGLPAKGAILVNVSELVSLS